MTAPDVLREGRHAACRWRRRGVGRRWGGRPALGTQWAGFGLEISGRASVSSSPRHESGELDGTAIEE